MSANFDISGITGNVLQIGSETGGPKIKNASGVLQFRNAADTTDIKLTAANPEDLQDVATKSYVDSQISGHSPAIVIPFSWTDIGTPKVSTATVPATAIVAKVTVITTLAFTGGSNPTCLVEVHGAATDTTISSTSQSNLTTIGQDVAVDLTDIPSGQGGPVRVTLGGTASAGSGKVVVEYLVPST